MIPLQALQVKNGEGDTVLTSAVRSEELAVVKEVLECVTNYLTDEKVKRSAGYTRTPCAVRVRYCALGNGSHTW